MEIFTFLSGLTVAAFLLAALVNAVLYRIRFGRRESY